METAPQVTLVGITKRFGTVLANDGVSLTLEPGQVHALLGENGAGKSTLMSILAGLYRPDTGQILLNGQPVTFRAPSDALRAGIGMVYQHFMLVDALTVAENILLGARTTRLWIDRRRFTRELAAVSQRYRLPVDPDAPVWQLSLGERQRVEILRLLFYGARVLIFDEPTAVLTPQEADQLLQTLREFAARGLSVVFISHKLREVLAVADQITVLRRGRVVATLPAAQADRRQLALLMVGHDLAMPQRQASPPGPELLQVRDLHVRDDRGRLAIRGVDLLVHGGEIVGLAGVAGNGQRELAEALTGLRRIERGSIRLGKQDLTGRTVRAFLEAGVAFIPEDRLEMGLCRSLSLWENAVLRQYYRPPFARGPLLDRRTARVFAERLAEEYGIVPLAVEARTAAFSGGNQQKLLIGRELAGAPRVVVAMYPTRGVDVGSTQLIYRKLLEYRNAGVGILFISEDLDELFQLADRIGVLYEGRLMGLFPASEIDREHIGLLMAGLTVDALPKDSEPGKVNA